MQEAPSGDMLKACPTAPCRGAHSAPHRHSAAETRFRAAEIGPTCLTMCPLSDTFGAEAGTFLPLSFLLRFPLFPPVPLSSSTQTLVTLTSCTLDMRNVVGNFARHPSQCTLVSVILTKQIRALVQKQTFLKSIFPVLSITITPYSLYITV